MMLCRINRTMITQVMPNIVSLFPNVVILQSVTSASRSITREVSAFGKRIIFFLFIPILIIPYVCFCEELEVSKKNEYIASSQEDKILRIGLVDCIAYALKNNSEIKLKRIEPIIQDKEINKAGVKFEPYLTLETALEDTKEQSSSSTLFSPAISTSTTAKVNAALEGRLPTGTEYSIDFENKKYKSSASYQVINPYYKTDATITITQPLLKGAGLLVNRADIIIAQNSKSISQEDFRKEVSDILSKTKTAYYDFIFSLGAHKIANLFYEYNKKLYEINKKRYGVGLISSVGLLETESAFIKREKILLESSSKIRQAEDNLKLITNLIDDPKLWNARIEPIGEPVYNPQRFELSESLKSAFENRPDYKKSKIDLSTKDIRIKLAKNSIYPEVDLVGSFGLNGLNGTYPGALDNLKDDYRDYSIGLEVKIPLGNAYATSDYEKRNLEKTQALITFKRLEENIVLEVRDSIRQLELQQKQIEVAKKRKEMETKSYLAQESRFKEGLISTHDLLDFQERLAQSELEYVRALIDYELALIRLDEVTGLTLTKNNVRIEDQMKP